MKQPFNRSVSVEVGNDEYDVSCIDPEPDGTVPDEYKYSTVSTPVLTHDMNGIGGNKVSKDTTGKLPGNNAETADRPKLSVLSVDELKNDYHSNKCVKDLDTKGKTFKYLGDMKHSIKRQLSDIVLEKIVTPVVNHKPIKEGRQLLRWNLLFNLLVWLVISLPIWMPFVSNYISIFLLPAIQSMFVLMWIVICILASRNMYKIFRFKNRQETPDIETPIHHLFVISCYKEPVDLIARSVQTIANQVDIHNISMTISFEEKTPDLKKKVEQLKGIFENSGFARLIFAVHPFGLKNEIPGKCSNSNNGFRESVNVLQRELGPEFDAENTVITTCDADSQFPPNYTSALALKFHQTKHKHATIFQAPLFYNWGLDGASFITRVTGLIRSTLMMGALIPFNINSMSIFSFSLRLCIDGNYVHPAYQMDDIICLIRWMGVTKRRIKICALPVPVLSGPTSGATVEIDIMEWARQARRWTIGAAEVFHYFVIKSRRMPAYAAFSWGISFLIYYGILLCSGALYSLSMSLSMTFLVDNTDMPDFVQYWMYGLAGAQQLCFLVVFILDVFATRALGVKECICLARNILHWILSPLVLIFYSLVEFYALHEVAILGKKVCKHGASNKDALKA